MSNLLKERSWYIDEDCKLATIERNKIVKLTIYSNPVGYYAVGARPDWKRMKRYHSFQAHIRLTAMKAGIHLPLHASKEEPLHVRVVSYFHNGVHSDPGNVQKGVCDALFYRPKTPGTRRTGGGDKWTGGSFEPPRYDKENPRCEVTIYYGDCKFSYQGDEL